MKNTIILFLIFGLGNNAPNLKEWTKQNKTQRKYLTQQIALLKTYGDFLKKGYTICKNGLNTIGSIQDADFKQHKVYFNSLKDVNSSIAKSPQVKQILDWEKELNKEMKSFITNAAKDPAFTSEEKKYFDQVATNVRTASEDTLDQLDRLITSGKTSMEDDERLTRINSLHRSSSIRFSFVRSFKDQAMTLVAQRRKEKQEVDYSLLIHQSL